MKLVCCHYTILHFMPYISKYRALWILSKSYTSSNYLTGGARRNRTFATKNSPDCLANSSLNRLSIAPYWWEGKDLNFRNQKVADVRSARFNRLHTFPCYSKQLLSSKHLLILGIIIANQSTISSLQAHSLFSLSPLSFKKA